MNEQRLTPADLPYCTMSTPTSENRRFYMLCEECDLHWIQREQPRRRCNCQQLKRLKRCEFTCTHHSPNVAYFYGFNEQGEALFSCLDVECTPYVCVSDFLN